MGHYDKFYEEQSEKYAKEFEEIQQRNKTSAMKGLKERGYTSSQIEGIFKQRQIQKILDHYKI